jgi:hypothetical protein
LGEEKAREEEAAELMKTDADEKMPFEAVGVSKIGEKRERSWGKDKRDGDGDALSRKKSSLLSKTASHPQPACYLRDSYYTMQPTGWEPAYNRDSADFLQAIGTGNGETLLEVRPLTLQGARGQDDGADDLLPYLPHSNGTLAERFAFSRPTTSLMKPNADPAPSLPILRSQEIESRVATQQLNAALPSFEAFGLSNGGGQAPGGVGGEDGQRGSWQPWERERSTSGDLGGGQFDQGAPALPPPQPKHFLPPPSASTSNPHQPGVPFLPHLPPQLTPLEQSMAAAWDYQISPEGALGGGAGVVGGMGQLRAASADYGQTYSQSGPDGGSYGVGGGLPPLSNQLYAGGPPQQLPLYPTPALQQQQQQPPTMQARFKQHWQQQVPFQPLFPTQQAPPHQPYPTPHLEFSPISVDNPYPGFIPPPSLPSALEPWPTPSFTPPTSFVSYLPPPDQVSPTSHYPHEGLPVRFYLLVLSPAPNTQLKRFPRSWTPTFSTTSSPPLLLPFPRLPPPPMSTLSRYRTLHSSILPHRLTLSCNNRRSSLPSTHPPRPSNPSTVFFLSSTTPSYRTLLFPTILPFQRPTPHSSAAHQKPPLTSPPRTQSSRERRRRNGLVSTRRHRSPAPRVEDHRQRRRLRQQRNPARNSRSTCMRAVRSARYRSLD